MANEQEIRERILIDKNDLDTELVQQADLFYEAASQAALLGSEADALKERLERRYSELDTKYRADAASTDEKITEKGIEAKIKADPDYVKLKKRHLETLKNRDQFVVLKESITQRGYALKELAQLYIANYYTVDSVKPTKQTTKGVLDKDRRKGVEAYKSKRK